MRARITFQDMVRDEDGQGGNETSWVDVKTVWAQIKPASGLETVFAQQITPRYDYMVIMRWTTGINAKMRIKFEDRIFHIKSIAREDEERWFMKLQIKEGVAS